MKPYDRIKQRAIVFEEMEAGCEAALQGDADASMRHCLNACIEAAGSTMKMRFVMLQQLDVALQQQAKSHTKSTLLVQEWGLFKTRVADNANETTVVYRAYASYLFACAHLMVGIDADSQAYRTSIQCLQLTVRLCDGASENDRLQRLLTYVQDDDTGKTAWAGTLLDKLRSRAMTEMEYQKSPWIYTQNMFSEVDTAATWEEIAKNGQTDDFVGYGHPHNMFLKPPVVTTAMIEKIKALPEDHDTIVLIVPNAFPFSAPRSPAVDDTGYMPYIPGRHPSTESLQAMTGMNDTYPVRVFTVDMDRFRSGKTTRVFDQIQVLFCSPEEKRRQKKLVSAFAATSLRPFAQFRGQKQTHAAARPTKVLLTPTDAKDSNVLLFLKMMGVKDLEEADSKLLNLLNNTFWEEVNVRSSRHIVSFDKVPAMSDMMLGVRCMNCNKVGPAIKACPCGKAWFCGTECQRLHWPLHKKDHKAIIKYREHVATKPEVLFGGMGGVAVKHYQRIVSEDVNCSYQAPVLLHWYHSIIKCKKRDPFAPVNELKLIDVTKYIKHTLNDEELYRFVLEGKGRSSLQTAKHLFNGPTIMCNLTTTEIVENFRRYGPGLVSVFRVYQAFKENSEQMIYSGLPSNGRDSLGQHSLVLLNVVPHEVDNENCWLVLQNSWKSKPYVRVDLVYFRACNPRLFFFDGSPIEPSDDWSMPAEDKCGSETAAELESDDYIDD